MSALIVIPARMGSTRFPNKPLALIARKTMIQRVWEIGKAAHEADQVVIATDSLELKQACEAFGASVVMTDPRCLTGTDRVAETIMNHPFLNDIVLSLQGDAVLTPPWVIDALIAEMKQDSSVSIATPAVKLAGEALTHFIDQKRRGSTTGTSVVFDNQRNALYFSKALIPFIRSEQQESLTVWRHIGLYAYRREALITLTQLPEGKLEKTEKLEQLRALENGMAIRVVPVDYRGRSHGSVDRPEDVAHVESLIAKEGELLESCLS
ncbi:MAG: 3-deoxy-manno-octulosonate cytidylyltransferase [Chlamydiia bacterium]|nr:3-deoxy-manno-octulosonate cytidylyltransferase [Chlamydiia bacterium]